MAFFNKMLLKKMTDFGKIDQDFPECHEKTFLGPVF